jgi:signal transduction histidine kinase
MVRRVVDLISQLSEACHGAVTLRSAGALAARALTSQFPGSSVIVFERDEDKDTLRAVAGANIPDAWQMRAVHLGEVPMLGKALEAPRQLACGAAGTGREAICGAVPDRSAPVYVLMFIAPIDPAEREFRELAIEAARHLLSVAAAGAVGGSARSRTASAIHHAKVEWEKAADALSELVGLVDRRQRVVRVNRALERWSLGDVREALGRDLHQMLHPNCPGAGCELHARLGEAFEELAASGGARVDLTDPVLGLDLIVELSAASNHYDPQGEQPWQRAAFVVSDVTALHAARRELANLNQSLEQRVADRTLEITGINRALRKEVARRAEAERSLRTSQAELETLSAQLMNAQEEERRRIAQDLHDSIGQSLSAIKYSLERAQVLARRQDLKAAGEVVESAVQRVQRAIDELRGIAMNLRPAQLDDLGAASAVRWLCREWHEVYADIAIDTDIAIDDTQVPPMLATNVFRTVQESLNNVARHAAAHRVQVVVRLDSGTLTVTVRDDGNGFSEGGNGQRAIAHQGLGGLTGLRERAERTGGRCNISSTPGQGTTVRVEWPVAPGLAAREANAWVN